MADRWQLIIMNDADMRMLVICANELIIIVYLLYFDVVFLCHIITYLLQS